MHKIEIFIHEKLTFRTWTPYKIDGKEINHNLIRVADVWMDEFKYLFYGRLGKFDQPAPQLLPSCASPYEAWH